MVSLASRPLAAACAATQNAPALARVSSAVSDDIVGPETAPGERLLTYVPHCCTTYNNVIRISALRAEAAIGAATATPGGAIAAPASPPIGPATVGRSGPFDDDEVV